MPQLATCDRLGGEGNRNQLFWNGLVVLVRNVSRGIITLCCTLSSCHSMTPSQHHYSHWHVPPHQGLDPIHTIALCNATGLPHSPVSSSTINAFPARRTSVSPPVPDLSCTRALDAVEGWDEGSRPANAAFDNARCHADMLLA